MKLHSLLFTAVFLAPFLRAEEEEKPPTEVAVQVAQVARATLTHSVTAYGSVEPEPASKDLPPALVKLSPAIPGILAEIHGVEGQAVKKGEVLFKLDSRAVDAARLKAEQAVEFATTTLERQKKLIAAEGTSAKQVMEAEQALAAATTELAAATVQQSLLVGASPISGTLVKFTARPGEAADSTTVLAEIVDLDRVVAAVRIPRAEALAVKVGQTAKVFSTDSDRPINSNVGFVSPQVDANTDTVAVRLPLPKDSGLRAGEFVTARVTIEQHNDILAVPRDAVYTDHDGQSTLSVVSGDTATKKVVKVGLRDGDLIEVEGEGVAEGATVVTLGSYALPEETKVRITETPAKETK
jgi:membrane fusion protein (multidrug efflux system)